MAAEFGAEREAVVARELTKLHETVYRGTLARAAASARSAEENFARGEITLVVARRAPPPPPAWTRPQLRRTVDAAAEGAAARDVPRRWRRSSPARRARGAYALADAQRPGTGGGRTP